MTNLTATDAAASLQQFMDTHRLAASIFLSLVLLLLASYVTNRHASKNQAPTLRERVPYLYNIIQYTTDMGSFLSRAT